HPCVQPARTWEPVQLVEEEIERQQAEPEDGHRRANERDEASQMVWPPIVLDRPDDPERDADNERESHRGERQFDRARHELPEIVHDWSPGGERFSQVTLEEVA